MQILLKKATIVSPTSKFHLKKKDIFIKNGIIDKIADSITEKNAKIIESKNLHVSIGWMDLFADFCEPGFEQKETIESGIMVAASGGFTDVCVIPNTNPVIGDKSMVASIKNKSTIVNLLPLGVATKNCEGKDLSEMYDMSAGGAVAFTDGKKPIQNAGLLLKALQYIKSFNGVIIQIPEEQSLTKHGNMNEGIVSTNMGMQAKPAIAESIMIQRDLDLLEYTESKIHFTGVSTKKGLELIRQAKKKGLGVTCSVSPHHLIFTDENLKDYDSVYKVNPPLRTELDRKALLKGVQDGTIDAIASHHIPQDWDSKQKEFEYAQDGMIHLQTILSELLQADSTISIDKWIELLTTNPRNIVGWKIPEIKENENACLTFFDAKSEWLYDSNSNKSLSENSPLLNKQLLGKVIGIINNNQIYINE